jgi:DNA-binding CsgD family transcriptional regulator
VSNADVKPPAYLTMTNVDPQDWCVAFTSRPKLIGRSPQVDVPISDRHVGVSRRHAEIWTDRGTLQIRDVGSKAGTHVNGVWLNGRSEAKVFVGDRIWIGGIEFQVVDDVPLMAQVLADSEIVGLGEATEGAGAATATADGLARSTEFQLAKPPHPVRAKLAQLSQAELQIVLWIGRGFMDDVELGQQLHRSPNTVRTQLNSIFRKLDLHSRTDIVAFLKRGK